MAAKRVTFSGLSCVHGQSRKHKLILQYYVSFVHACSWYNDSRKCFELFPEYYSHVSPNNWICVIYAIVNA